MTYGLTKFDTIKIAKKNEVFYELDVWHGASNKVKSYVVEDIYKTIPKRQKKYLKVSINFDWPIKAPIKKDHVLGVLNIYFKDKLIGNYDLQAYENIKKQNIISRLMSSINFLIWGDV